MGMVYHSMKANIFYHYIIVLCSHIYSIIYFSYLDLPVLALAAVPSPLGYLVEGWSLPSPPRWGRHRQAPGTAPGRPEKSGKNVYPEKVKMHSLEITLVFTQPCKQGQRWEGVGQMLTNTDKMGKSCQPIADNRWWRNVGIEPGSGEEGSISPKLDHPICEKLQMQMNVSLNY